MDRETQLKHTPYQNINLNELEKRLSSQDIEIYNAQNILKIPSENKSKFKWDFCKCDARPMKVISIRTKFNLTYLVNPSPGKPQMEICVLSVKTIMIT